MAVLTDILIAPATDASAVIAEWPGLKTWPAFQTTGLDWLVLTELAEALNQPELAEAIENLDPAASANETSGPWVYVLPTELRDSLSNLDPDKLASVAEAWSGGEEANARGLGRQDAERLLPEIRALAVRARDGQKPLLLWISS